jgi:hypothetical protein
VPAPDQNKHNGFEDSAKKGGINGMSYAKIAGSLVALALVSGCGTFKAYRVDCGATDVIVKESEAQRIVADTGSVYTAAVGTCKVFENIDASAYDRPHDVTVTMPDGRVYHGKVQRSVN